MTQISFANLNDFLNFENICPLCRSRLHIGSLFLTTEVSNKCIYMSNGTGSDLLIDLFTNEIDINPKYDVKLIGHKHIEISKTCNKYHYFYQGIATMDMEHKILIDIVLYKIHFIRQLNKTHFTINSNYINNTTDIRITGNDYKTREITSALIEFDISNKKKLNRKLKNIELLG